MLKLLIDGDIILYSVAFSMETPVYVCGNMVYINKEKAVEGSKKKGIPLQKRMSIGGEKELRSKLVQKMKNIFSEAGSKDYIMYLTGREKENYRNKIATILPYKGNRIGNIKPASYDRLRVIMLAEYKTVETQGQEADDALAIDQMESKRLHGTYERTMICSIDKDLQQVPGYHYNFNHNEISFVEEDQALKNFYRQVLVGDPGDNIPGLTKTLRMQGRQEEADKLSRSHFIKKYDELTLDFTPEQMYNHTLGMFEAYGYAEKELLEISDLLWLRRYEGQIYSEDKKAGKL